MKISLKTLIDRNEIKLVSEVLKSPFLHGKKSIVFEKEFSKFTKAKNWQLLIVHIGFDLSYLAMGLKKGDEVILPAQTHVATAHTIEIMGAKPVFIDADLNGNINIDLIQSKINKNTKCITVVHFLGFPVDMIKILRIAKKYKLRVVEDCALALGAKIGSRHVGNFGDFGCFSFTLQNTLLRVMVG